MKRFNIKIAAQFAADGKGVAYTKYCIPEPKSFEEYVEKKNKLNALPRDQIGASIAVEPVPSPKSLELERGGAPIDLVVCEELLNHLKTHRKSLSIFSVEEIADAAPEKRSKY